MMKMEMKICSSRAKKVLSTSSTFVVLTAGNCILALNVVITQFTASNTSSFLLPK